MYTFDDSRKNPCINTQPLKGLGFYMNTGARCAARPGLALLGFLVRRKERARVSALRFSWALIEQRKRNKPRFRNRLGSLAAIGLVLARCAGCSALLGAV